MKITIYHNPRWGKSRDSVRILEENNLEFTTVEYLKTPISRDGIVDILDMLDVPTIDLIRKTEKEYTENDISSIDNDEELIDMIVKFPKLMQRPIIVADQKAVIGRPPENILDIL